jgi:hypothetical protein
MRDRRTEIKKIIPDFIPRHGSGIAGTSPAKPEGDGLVSPSATIRSRVVEMRASA